MTQTRLDDIEMFPPHTRGSTVDALVADGRVAVSPAYAGIDPRARETSDSLRCFPRIRGDRPFMARARYARI